MGDPGPSVPDFIRWDDLRSGRTRTAVRAADVPHPQTPHYRLWAAADLVSPAAAHASLTVVHAIAVLGAPVATGQPHRVPSRSPEPGARRSVLPSRCPGAHPAELNSPHGPASTLRRRAVPRHRVPGRGTPRVGLVGHDGDTGSGPGKKDMPSSSAGCPVDSSRAGVGPSHRCSATVDPLPWVSSPSPRLPGRNLFSGGDVMSNLERDPLATVCGTTAATATHPVRELLPGREVRLGVRNTTVRHTLPHRDRRMVGAWCFVDHYGPQDITGEPGMRVPPHPHTELQTVSWLVAGEVLHRDSLGTEQLILPGQLNLMTAGRGIAHSEESPQDHSPVLHGVQLWVALPERHRHVAPHFEHHPELPVVTGSGLTVTVLIGEFDGAVSPATAYSPLLGAEIALLAAAQTRLPLRPEFEHAVLTLAGEAEVDGVPLPPGALLYLGTGRTDLLVRAEQPSRLLLLGGEPFEERIVMWWNFVSRSHEEIVRAREEWNSGRGFGTVHGYDGAPLVAPPLPTTPLRPRGRHR